jgi:heptosyltransferase III
MRSKQDILSLVQAKDAEVARESQRAVILQPGALGDCILTLPLAQMMKRTLHLGGIDIIGHAEYIDFLPGRSCVDSIRSIDSADLHRLFTEAAGFDLTDRDPLIGMFSDYAWIVSFLGDTNGDFERNLIFTANCSHSAEVFTVALKPPEGLRTHVAAYYLGQFVEHVGMPKSRSKLSAGSKLIRPTRSDSSLGRRWLKQEGLELSGKLAVLHPGSGGRHKCWHIENFIDLAEDLRRTGLDVLFLLGPAERERLSDSDLRRLHDAAACRSDLALPQVVALLCCAAAFVGNDSGVTHLAAGMGLPTVALFGPTDPARYAPLGPALKVVHDPHPGFSAAPAPELRKAVAEAVAALISS